MAWPDLAIADGRRVSPADAYLLPAVNRPNLTVLGGCLVTRLLISGGRCAGAAYLRDGVPQQAHASAEVIVCAGAIGSPQLLMLSGIGPAEHLRGVGIDPVADLPGTGANLQDHPIAMACYASAVPLPRSRYNHGETYSALSSPLAGAWPDLHVFPILLPVAPPGLKAPAGGFALVASAVAPDSRGSVRLASASPLDAPLIDPGLLREPGDLERLEAGLAMIRRLRPAAAFARLGVTEAHPGPGVRGGEPAGVDQAHGEQLLPPGRHLPDRPRHGPGRGGRPGTARPRHHRAAGRRRVGDAPHPQRPPERDRARHRRARRRPHRRPPFPAARQPRPHHAATDKKRTSRQ